jgi:diguanylate cyclase (GGDEF)-like protein
MGYENVPASKDAEIAALRSRLRMLEAVIDHFPGGILLTDRDLKVVLCNAQQRELLEFPEELFTVGSPTLEELFRFNALRGEYGPGDIEVIVAGKLAQVSRRLPHVFERTRPNGTVLEVRGTPLPEGGFVTSYVDVTEQRRNQALIAKLAQYDMLTGLPNRNLLLERLNQALARVRRGEQIALHYVDLDRFKPVNDTYGHEAGDKLLRAVGERLLHCVREVDTVARFGGDEFVVLQSNIADASSATALAERIIKSLSRTFELGIHRLDIGASAGIAVAPGDGLTDDALLRRADAALYESKRAGKGQCRFYSQAGSASPVT